jgi:hypothetical protein
MWLVRMLGRLALKVAVAFGIALAIAAIQAPFRRDGFLDGLVISAYALGGFLLVMGALGGAAYGRVADAEARARGLGKLPGLPPWAERREDEPAETQTTVFLLAGLALIALGIALPG